MCLSLATQDCRIDKGRIHFYTSLALNNYCICSICWEVESSSPGGPKLGRCSGNRGRCQVTFWALPRYPWGSARYWTAKHSHTTLDGAGIPTSTFQVKQLQQGRSKAAVKRRCLKRTDVHRYRGSGPWNWTLSLNDCSLSRDFSRSQVGMMCYQGWCFS